MSVEVGERLANEGSQLAIIFQREWSRKAEDWFETLVPGDTFTSEDMITAIGFPAQLTPNSNNAIGSKIRTWSHAGLVTKRGYAKTTRSQSHSRIIALWEKK
jgi:hypothetical protein